MSFTMAILVLLLGTVIEIGSLTWLAGQISDLNVISMVMFTLLLGVIIGRGYGDEFFDKMQWHLKSREAPADEVVNGAVMRVSSYLLLTPGAVTDVIGLLIAFPKTRFIFKNLAMKLYKSKVARGEQWFLFKND